MIKSINIFRHFLSITFIVLLAACKKDVAPEPEADPTFDHEVSAPQNCAECAAADSYEGTFKGVRDFGTGTVPGIGDSITIVVDHIFKSKGLFIDSTRMFLKLKIKNYNNPDTIIWITEVEKGRSSISSGERRYNFWFSHNQLKMNWYGDHYDQPNFWTYAGYRIP